MSIASEITRLQQAKNTLKEKLNAKNDSEHQITNETLDQYGAFVDTISGEKTLVKNIQAGFNVSNAMFTVDTTGYTSQELINGLAYDSENIHYGFGSGSSNHAYVVYVVSGAFINGFVESLKEVVDIGVYKPYAIEFGTVEDAHFYVAIVDINITTELPANVYILNDLTTNTNYGNFLMPKTFVYGGDQFDLPNSVLWNCMKLIKEEN